MRRILFILSHHCSGSNALYQSLDNHPKIEGFRHLHKTYDNPEELYKLATLPHKRDDASAIYMDELLTNQSIARKSVYPIPKYVFVLRDPKDTLNEMVVTKKYSPKTAADYYSLRLRRILSIARHAKDSVLLTFADLEAGKGGEVIAEYLKLKDRIELVPAKSLDLDNTILAAILQEATEEFEKTLFKMKKLGLRTPTP